MEESFSDRLRRGSWVAPVAELVGAFPVSFGPVFEGRLTASARVAHRGRTIGLVECDVANAEGKPVARVSSTCQVLRGEAAEGR